MEIYTDWFLYGSKSSPLEMGHVEGVGFFDAHNLCLYSFQGF